MKRIVLIIVASFITLVSFSQDWSKALMERQSKGEKLTLHEISKEFNAYWESYNVQGGYYVEDGVKKKASGWKQFKRWEWYWSSRVNPITGEFPATSTPAEMQKFRMRDSKAIDMGDWVQMGPESSKGGYAGIGRINVIAFHPTDNDTYWAGSPGGGLWMTTDNGNT